MDKTEYRQQRSGRQKYIFHTNHHLGHFMPGLGKMTAEDRRYLFILSQTEVKHKEKSVLYSISGITNPNFS